ncbi:MBL fold metallo-hydrolase [Streptomyces sp. NPDC050856]|uniref:MBL fold metallo-hydrolase n=1 Tax=Streptomyces sp. NPDC050856 TaxID=3154939 RepID=UPI0033D735B2
MTRLPRHDGGAGHPSRRRFGRLAALGLAVGAGSLAQAPPVTAAGADARTHYDRARRLAGNDPVLLALVRALTPGATVPHPPAPEPVRIFDDLAVLSTGWVSALALLTEDGIVLIDALTSPQEAENVLVAGLRRLGADPGRIRYVVVTHGHQDHFGGARYLVERFGARVLMAPADWDLVARTRPEHAPGRDLDIRDGQLLTLGGTTVQLHHTPGHTPGTVSAVFPVRAGRERHTAMLWGGMNPPATTTELRTHLASIASFRAAMRRMEVEVELSNHPNDHGLERIQQLRDRPRGANPFVLGRPRAQRFMAVMDAMIRGRLADTRGGGVPGGSGLAATPPCC